VSITLKQAADLRRGQIVHHSINKNSDGSCERWRVTGAPKTWKTQPWRIKVPVKHGLRDYSYITEAELSLVHLESDCRNHD